MNRFSIFWHILVTVIFCITLPAVAPTHPSAKYVFTKFQVRPAGGRLAGAPWAGHDQVTARRAGALKASGCAQDEEWGRAPTLPPSRSGGHADARRPAPAGPRASLPPVAPSSRHTGTG